MSKYELGKCIQCKKYQALCDGICLKCAEAYRQTTLPDIFKDLFKNKEK